jgi:hypothetical protein
MIWHRCYNYKKYCQNGRAPATHVKTMFYGMFVVLSSLSFICVLLSRLLWQITLMLIGVAALTLDVLPLVTTSTTETVWSLGLLSDILLSLAPVLKLSIMLWCMFFAKCCWLRQLLQELHRHIHLTTLVYCDNVSAMFSNRSTSMNQAHWYRYIFCLWEGVTWRSSCYSCTFITTILQCYD